MTLITKPCENLYGMGELNFSRVTHKPQPRVHKLDSYITEGIQSKSTDPVINCIGAHSNKTTPVEYLVFESQRREMQ